MAQYSYKARDSRGSLVEGFLEGENENEIRQQLAAQGLIPIQVLGKSANLEIKLPFGKGGKVKEKELVLFTKQFHTLFKAGMGVESLLATLARQTKNEFFKETLEKIRKDIQEGATLAMAFGRHPKVFDPLYVNMIASGEEAGILEEVLDQLANLIEKDYTMRKNIKAAMLYPKIVVGVLFIAAFIMMILVVPQFKSVFNQFKTELPLPTRLLIGTSDFMTNYWYVVLGGIGVMIFAYKKYYSTAKGRMAIDKLSFKVPIFGQLGLKVANARFANILGSLYRSGLPVTKALEITAKTMSNVAVMQNIKKLQSDVEKGSSLSESMRKQEYFSGVIIEATGIGERSGALDSMLKSIAEHFEMEVNHTVKNLTTYIEPILLGFIFGMVLMFALAIFLPMWRLHSAVMD